VISDEVVEERRVRNAMEWLAAIPDKRKSRDMPKGLRPYRAGALERFEAAGVHEPSARTEGGAVIWLLFSFVFLFGAAFWLAGQVNSLWPYLVPIGAVAVYVNFAGLVIGTRRDLSRYGSLAMQRVIEAEAAAQDAEWDRNALFTDNVTCPSGGGATFRYTTLPDGRYTGIWRFDAGTPDDERHVKEAKAAISKLNKKFGTDIRPAD